MFREKVLGSVLALGLVFTGATGPVEAIVEEVRDERAQTVLLSEDAASADAGNKKVAAPPVALEGDVSFQTLNNVEAASADASENQEVVAQATPQALAVEGVENVSHTLEEQPVAEEKTAQSIAVNAVVPFARSRQNLKVPIGAELVVAGRPATRVAHDPSKYKRLSLEEALRSHDEYWERLRQEREEAARKKQEEIAPSPTPEVEEIPVPEVEETEVQTHSPPTEEVEPDSTPTSRELTGDEDKPSTEVEEEALETPEEPASPQVDVELNEEVVNIQKKATSSSESGPVQTETQEEPNETGSDSVTDLSDSTTDEGAQVEASETVEQENVVTEETQNEVPEGNTGLEETVPTTDESGSAESLESTDENLEAGENASENQESEGGNSDLDSVIPADESEIGADDPLESVENAEAEEVAPPEVSTSVGVFGVSSDDPEDPAKIEVGIGYSEEDFGVETTIKTPVDGGETAVDVETTLPLSETASVSLKAEDLLSEDATTISARADFQALPRLVVSPEVEKASGEAAQFNLSAALQATDTFEVALDIEDVGAIPTFNVEGNLALGADGQHEVIARINDVSAVEARTFDLEGSIQIIEWAKASVRLESIFADPVVGLGAEFQLNRSTSLELGVNDTFGSQTFDFKLQRTFGF